MQCTSSLGVETNYILLTNKLHLSFYIFFIIYLQKSSSDDDDVKYHRELDFTFIYFQLLRINWAKYSPGHLVFLYMYLLNWAELLSVEQFSLFSILCPCFVLLVRHDIHFFFNLVKTVSIQSFPLVYSKS